MAGKRKFTFIDLFAGCGGLCEGFYRKGFQALAHVEIDRFACEPLRERMRHYGYDRVEKEVVEHDIMVRDILTKICLFTEIVPNSIICYTMRRKLQTRSSFVSDLAA